jgi:hypothetical protein
LKKCLLAVLIASPLVWAQAPTPASPASADPADPGGGRTARGLPLCVCRHAYRGGGSELADWKKANADVGQFRRGHVDLLRVGRAEQAQAPPRQARATPSRSTGHHSAPRGAQAMTHAPIKLMVPYWQPANGAGGLRVSVTPDGGVAARCRRAGTRGKTAGVDDAAVARERHGRRRSKPSRPLLLAAAAQRRFAAVRIALLNNPQLHASMCCAGRQRRRARAGRAACPTRTSPLGASQKAARWKSNAC